MGQLHFPNLQAAKMAFTDLIPLLLGSSGVNINLKKNVKDFFRNQKPSGSLSTRFQKFQERFQAADFLVGQIKNPVVQMFLNPDTIQVNKKVLFDKKQTRGGFVIQFWGHDLEEISVSAATAYFDVSKEPLKAFELLKRQVYQGRFHSIQPFRGSPIIAMLFESQVLKGYFTDFSYKLSSQSPFAMTYSFNFVVTENLTFFLSSNIAQTLRDITNTGASTSNPATDASILPEQFQFGRGWGVQLF